MSRKELRAPDAFQRAGGEARQWLQEKQKVVAAIAAAILLGGTGVALASYVSERGEGHAARKLGAALKVLERSVEGDARAAPDASEPPFKTQREKDEAALQALSNFRTEHRGTRAGTSAALPQAHAALRLGKFDEALGAFEDYLKSTPPDDPLRAAALEGQGYVYEAKGQMDAAVAAFEQLARSTPGEFLAGIGLYHRARLLALQGKKEEAAKALAEISGAYPNTAAARLAKERLALLVSQGVTPPPAAPAADAG